MSVASEITRLQNAKASLKTAIEGKGVTVSSSTKLDGYADLVDSIQQGGGGGDDEVIEAYLSEDEVYTINIEDFQASGKVGHRVYYIKDSSSEGARVIVRKNGVVKQTIDLDSTTGYLALLFFWKDTDIPFYYYYWTRKNT